MKTSRFTDSQIIAILKQAEAGILKKRVGAGTSRGSHQKTEGDELNDIRDDLLSYGLACFRIINCSFPLERRFNFSK